jgi:hypothetical protein
MRASGLLCLSLLFTLSTILSAQSAGPKAPAITIQKTSITVDGLTPQGQVVWFSVAREVADDDVATVVSRSDVKTDEDGDGKVVWELEGEVPLRSIWVAVDLATGRFAAATPAGYPLRRVGFRGRGLARGTQRSDHVEDARHSAEILLVRPGKGAWRSKVSDGRSDDEDGFADGQIAAALDRLRPVAGTAEPPSRFDPNDVVVLIDPIRMELTLQAATPEVAQ